MHEPRRHRVNATHDEFARHTRYDATYRVHGGWGGTRVEHDAQLMSRPLEFKRHAQRREFVWGGEFGVDHYCCDIRIAAMQPPAQRREVGHVLEMHALQVGVA
ncbi:MAG: hypothetical protein IT359_19765 [Gemmatimonadaceae bacterium]|nr:hypothetical protein [Gemmatimonadaceae bacterium]